MKVVVDPELCVGNGVCEATAPYVFAVDDSGQARVLVEEIPTDQKDLAADAVESCPARALKLAD